MKPSKQKFDVKIDAKLTSWRQKMTSWWKQWIYLKLNWLYWIIIYQKMTDGCPLDKERQ